MDAPRSRVSCMAACVDRACLGLGAGKRELTIHILGSEDVEYTNFERLLQEYAVLIAQLEERGVRALTIGIIGPSLFRQSETSHTAQVGDGFKIKVFAVPEYYHEFQERSALDCASDRPDLIALFNPGLWGYDSWLPTLSSFKQLHGCCVLSTAFTIEEGEDDSDIIEDSCGPDIRWNWEIEKNPYACTAQLDRKCAPEGRAYFDNYAWQCFSIL